jgi:hypothetical protein
VIKILQKAYQKSYQKAHMVIVLAVALPLNHTTLLQCMVPEQVNLAANQALSKAVGVGDLKAVDAALKAGADANYVDEHGFTVLRTAANMGTVKLLLARGANATLANRDGQTPLALARQYHHPDVVGLLEREAGRAVFGRVSRLGRTGEFTWRPTGATATLPPEIAAIVAQFAQAPGHIPPSGSVS